MLRGRLEAKGIEYIGPDRTETSMYFKDPDGIQVELNSEPLFEFGGRRLDE
jgi:glyoxylase I family protein